MRRGRRGFSLLELLIVIGIVGMLAAIGTSYLTGAHESGLDALCRSRLRQLAVFAHDYVLMNDYYPWGSINPATHDANYCKKGMPAELWAYPREDPVLHGVKSWSEFSTFCWDFRKKASEREWESGEMFGGQKVSSILGCPKCVMSGDNWDGNPMTGYNYNVCFLGYVEGDRSVRKYPIARGKVKFPDKVVIFGDGGYSGGPNKFMRAPFQDKHYDNSQAALRKAGTQAFRHGKGKSRHCNMAFADGHVEAFYTPYKAGGKEGWVDELTHTAFISARNGIYGPHGWGGYDEQDDK